MNDLDSPLHNNCKKQFIQADLNFLSWFSTNGRFINKRNDILTNIVSRWFQGALFLKKNIAWQSN